MAGTANPHKEAARALFFQYVPTEQIQDRLGVAKTTLHGWIHGKRPQDKATSWNTLRKQQTLEVLDDIKAHHIQGINKIYQLAIPLMHNNLVRIAKTNQPLDIRELKMLSDILTNFDKVLRLEAGIPTDIVATRTEPITVQELRDIILKDKFLDVIDIGDNDGTSEALEEQAQLGSGQDGSITGGDPDSGEVGTTTNSPGKRDPFTDQ